MAHRTGRFGGPVRIFPDPDTYATATLTLTGNAVAAETVTLGTQVYTWVAAVSVANDVLVGATASDSLDNLIAAVNAGAGAGTLYGTGTVANTFVSAAAGAGDTAVFTARAAYEGPAGNQVASTETMTNGSFASTKLSGGGASATTAAPTIDDGTLGVTFESSFHPSTTSGNGILRILLQDVDNVTGTTKTVSVASYGWFPFAGRWFPLGISASAETSTLADRLTTANVVAVNTSTLATRYYLQIAAIGGAGTEVEVWLLPNTVKG